MKALVPEVVHRSDEHAVVLDLGDERQVRETYRRMARRYGDRLQGVLVQQMVPAGLEVLIGVVQDPTFGPLVQVAAGGVATELAHDRVTRLLPLTDHDVADMLQSLQIAPVLAGFRGSPPLDSAALTGMIHRVARLVQDLPAITEMNVNPAIVQSTGCVAVDIKMRVEQVEATDPYLRRLR
jgi:acyl-CoA synthetase (NDP forming)